MTRPHRIHPRHPKAINTNYLFPSLPLSNGPGMGRAHLTELEFLIAQSGTTEVLALFSNIGQSMDRNENLQISLTILYEVEVVERQSSLSVAFLLDQFEVELIDGPEPLATGSKPFRQDLLEEEDTHVVGSFTSRMIVIAICLTNDLQLDVSRPTSDRSHLKITPGGTSAVSLPPRPSDSN
ncbi:hypothetical protein BDN72DRAFT_906282 [Pluteus cervinus]|uniref:Uncharacterized protein n=1 Tax=Pluteus cervinus TaxID=181527 RepID=A0ACD2ZZV0_9AGAR|nr:hypothetical protein BDN72DRAFT_906282 [Pluteus cervinus]